MAERQVILLGLMAAVAAPAAASTHAQGDAHVIRRERGDVLAVDGKPWESRADERRSEYVAPYRGWRYRALRTGHRLRAGFYGPRYVVANPGRLPAARRDQRWIRYGDDLLLVNIRNGRVLRVVSGGYRQANK